MSSQVGKAIYFGKFSVAPHVFYKASLSFAVVNIKPLLPGHVLVSPLRVVPRFSELTSSEVADIFLTVQKVSRMIERVFKATALNIAIQDGEDAGQSVKHVHVHIIPRNSGDLDHRGGSDAIYDMMDSEEGNVGRELQKRQESKFAAPDVGQERKPKSDEEMRKEATWLSQEMEKES